MVRVVALTVVGWIVTTVWLVTQREYRQRTGNAELARVVAETESSDPEWSWDRLNAARAKPPEGKNGAELVRRLREQWPPEWTKNFEPVKWEPDANDETPNVRYPAAVIADARAKLAHAHEAVVIARGLKDCPFGHRELVLKPNVMDTLLPDTAHTANVAKLLYWDTVLAIEDGDPRLAVNLLAQLNASRSLGDEPFLISQMVRAAARAVAAQSTERVLAQTALTPDALATLQAAWAADAEEPLLLYGTRGDRAALDVYFRNLTDGTVGPNHLTNPNPKLSSYDRFIEWLARGRVPGDRAFYLWWMGQAVAVAQLPPHEQIRALVLLPPISKDDPSIIYSRLFLPAAEKVTHAMVRCTGEARSTMVGIACERFRLASNRWPESLAELVPEFLPAVPLDPYDGQPLRYAKWADGAVVYSIGKKPPSSFGPAPPEVAKLGLPDGVEFGFRLWNPDKRRLAPPPEQQP